MRRKYLVLAGLSLVALLALGAAGVVAAAGWSSAVRANQGFGYMQAHGPHSGMMQGGQMPGGMMQHMGEQGHMGPGMMGNGTGSAATATPVVGATQVAIQGDAFQPATIQVQVGATVTWTNRDTDAHTVTFRGGLGSSARLAQGQTYQRTFETVGTYTYFCALHPYMVGTVIVVAS